MASRLNKRRRRYGQDVVPRWYRKHGKTFPEIIADRLCETHWLLEEARRSLVRKRMQP